MKNVLRYLVLLLPLNIFGSFLHFVIALCIGFILIMLSDLYWLNIIFITFPYFAVGLLVPRIASFDNKEFISDKDLDTAALNLNDREHLAARLVSGILASMGVFTLGMLLFKYMLSIFIIVFQLTNQPSYVEKIMPELKKENNGLPASLISGYPTKEDKGMDLSKGKEDEMVFYYDNLKYGFLAYTAGIVIKESVKERKKINLSVNNSHPTSN